MSCTSSPAQSLSSVDNKEQKMHTKPGQKEPSLLVKFVSAGLAASVAEAATIPIDTAKVRLQVSWSFNESGCLVV